jgi:small subunit ribosomal protein S20
MAEEKAAAPTTAAPGQKAEQKKKDENVRQPSALKRDIQSEKRRQRNSSLRSSVSTAIRSFEKALEQKEAPESIKSKLNSVYSLMDRGVKKGVFKPNKAARTKSRLTSRVQSS